ncbi:Ig-like domain-containing protein [bacterium]|nr:Ig-like domain-containing protein [bacterium]
MKLLTLVILTLGLLLISCEDTADTTPPDVSISSPVDGASVQDTVTIKVLVADDTGVDSVEFFIDGDLLAVDSDDPFEVSWITNDFTNGQHTIQCRAVDEAGNAALSEIIAVTIVDTRPPDVSITNPVDGATVYETVIIEALVNDDTGVTSVEFFVDGELITTDTNEPFEGNWITNDYIDGDYTIHCKAVDEAGNEALSDTLTVTVSNIILTATFTNDWLCPSCGTGVLFYSDMDGNLLWSGTWTGNESIDVMRNETIGTFPDRVIVSTVRSNLFNDEISITSNLYVKPESWTFKGNGYVEESIGSTSLEFQNAPIHQGYVIASKWGYQWHRSQVIPSPVDQDFRVTPDNLYIRINTDSQGPQYLWIEDVDMSQPQSVDLSNMTDLQSSEVSFPEMPFAGFWYGLRGFLGDSYYSGQYSVDVHGSWYYETMPSSITTYFPSTIFSGYLSTVSINEEEYPTNNNWFHNEIGVPDVVEIIDADFDFVSTEPNNFEISVSGDYTQINSKWSYDPGNGVGYVWNVYGTPESYILPELPTEVAQMYGNINEMMFTLEWATIQKHYGVTDYEDIIELIFMSDNFYWDVATKSLERQKDPIGLRP